MSAIIPVFAILVLCFIFKELRIEEIFSIVLTSSKPNSGCLWISLLKSIKNSLIEISEDFIKSLSYIIFLEP